jgi:hypothetical protein
MTTYAVKIWGQRYRIRADFSEAAALIESQYEDEEWQHTGWQVADFRHNPAAAMREFILAGEVEVLCEEGAEVESAVSMMD